VEQSTSDPPEAVGVNFAADIIKRNLQLILVLRETVTSYTAACIVANEQRITVRNALIQLAIELRPLDGPHAVIRTDPAPGFVGLVEDDILHQYRLRIDVGRIKNINKNPVGEKAVRELENELVRQQPDRGSVTSLTLSVAVACLNSRIRSRGLSAREMWSQRDQFTNTQLPIHDRDLIQDQHTQRTRNHPHSEASKAPRGKLPSSIQIEVGDLVYLYTDRTKTQARDRYLVVAIEDSWCYIRKFTGSQLRKLSYKVKCSECYKVPSLVPNMTNAPDPHVEHADFSDDEDTGSSQILPEPQYNEIPVPPEPPDIPLELSLPAHYDDVSLIEERLPVNVPEICESDVLPAHACDSDTLEPIATQSKRPVRSRRPPKYLEDYVL
jgi:hypothetical protein